MTDKSTIQHYIDEIKRIEVDPGIYEVLVGGASHMSGYKAWVSFRTHATDRPWMRECRTHGDTPEEALLNLFDVLLRITVETCPHCGGNTIQEAT